MSRGAVLCAFVAWMGIAASAACGSTPPMPKGPPPEYEEHDAGTPIFEGDPGTGTDAGRV